MGTEVPRGAKEDCVSETDERWKERRRPSPSATAAESEVNNNNDGSRSRRLQPSSSSSGEPEEGQDFGGRLLRRPLGVIVFVVRIQEEDKVEEEREQQHARDEVDA